jgi:hypothetical protein
VTCLWTRKNKGLISGGRDGVIQIWDQNMKSVKIELKDNSLFGSKIIAIAESNNGNLAIGTRTGQIIEYLDNKFRGVIV